MKRPETTTGGACAGSELPGDCGGLRTSSEIPADTGVDPAPSSRINIVPRRSWQRNCSFSNPMEATLECPREKRRSPQAPARPSAGFPLGRVAGIVLRAHASWLVIAALVVMSLEAEFGIRHSNSLLSHRWMAAALAAAAFFASVLVHELSHSLVARAKGIGVRSITLFVFGGVSRLKGEAKRPSDEFLIAFVGPLTSAVLGAAFLAFEQLFASGALPADVFHWLGRMNLALAAFNLLPGLPLDGGRVFRALAWRWTGDLRKATAWAALAGVAVANLLIVAGIFLAFRGIGIGDGILLAAVGLFLLPAAKSSVDQHDFHEMLGRLHAADAMDDSLAFVDPAERVEELTERVLRGRKERFAAEDETGVLGILTLEDLLAARRGRRSGIRVSEIMTPLDAARSVSTDDRLLDVLEKMDDLGVRRFPVLGEGILRGIVSREDILRRAALHLQLGATPRT